MAVRYVRTGNDPDYRDEVRGTLAEILAAPANPGAFAVPEDVTGCFLEMGADGKWAGPSVGNLTQAQADALAASGAMASVAVGTQGYVDAMQSVWSGPVTMWASDSYNVGTRTAFDFSSAADGAVPKLDSFGQPMAVYSPSPFGASAVVDGGYLRSSAANDTISRGFYLDTNRHATDINEAGATVRFDASGIVFALCLWKDYTSVIYPTGILTGATHIRFTTTSVSYDIWDLAGSMTTIGTAPLSLATNTDHKFFVRMSGPTAQVFVNDALVLTVSDSRIATLGRKVACFEPYQNASVAGYVRIKRGFSMSQKNGDDVTTTTLYTARKQKANTAPIVVSQSFVDLVDAVSAAPYKTVMAILKFPLTQTVAGDVFVDFYATTPTGTNTSNIVTANRDVRTGIITAMAYVTAVQGGTVKARVARDASAVATVPVSTYLDHPEMILLPVVG